MKWLDDIKTDLKKRQNLANCAKGKHRWTKAVNKLEGGKTQHWNFCQTCGATDEAPLEN